MNIQDIMKLKTAWDTFTANHPKFPAFLNAAKQAGIKEDTIVAISITDPEGKTIETNVKVTPSDLELFETLKGMHP
ncbi:MAG: hypothetical protein K6B28_01140 [Lachnospiraceae bacterium]|nr:hypothetical protein [Lachnospiraceae bacterium]